MKEVAIKIEGLSKIYKLYNKPIDRLYESLGINKKNEVRAFYALKDISLSIYKGETVGIIGTNGSGKSTLLKIITGVLSQTEGIVEVNGKVSALLELGAGFNYEYSGLENIYLNGTMMGYTHDEMEKKVPSILDFADIGEFINQPIKSYSSGMFARLAFAVAINVEPEILIVDEALSVGDMKFQIKCMNKMKEMMTGGTTVLFVSHDINAVRRFCTKAIWIKHGVLEGDGETNYIIDRYSEYLKLKDMQLEDVKVDALPSDASGTLAEIRSFQIYNEAGGLTTKFMYNEYTRIVIEYEVYELIPNPVIGVALLGVDGEYICGLNTLLDQINISWKIGKNKIEIEYVNGLRVVGGKYRFNVAIFDQTATVNIQYLDSVAEIEVYSNYVGEGKLIIPHEWRG